MSIDSNHLRSILPILDWSRHYDRASFSADLLAAIIVTLMLIPQSLAYALLAGLPAQTGLYASIAPLILYALFGTSRVLAVGPVAVISLMTAAALGGLSLSGAAYWQAAITLAFISGLMLLLLGMIRFGFLANFLSHPVISGFITASALIIAIGQLKAIFGVHADGNNLPQVIASLFAQLPHLHGPTFIIGAPTLAFLFWARRYLKPVLQQLGLSPRLGDACAKAGPVAAIVATTTIVWLTGWDTQGVRIVGTIPQELPPLTLPTWDPALWRQLLVPALLISLVGFAESVSVGQTLAAKRRQRIEPDRELIALGAGNLGAAFTGGFPVTGGFARSVVNFDAGAQTPASGIFTAIGIALASLLLTPALYYLPHATLAATIIVAVLSLVDPGMLRRTWQYSKSDFSAVITTVAATLWFGVEIGLLAGVGLSILLHLARSARPHIAIVGLVPGTEHFRNVERHAVQTFPELLSVRIDESLFFANARALENFIYAAVSRQASVQHVVLQCSAVNSIDASALESLEMIAERLWDSGIRLHLSEVKGPVMDRLAATTFLQRPEGQVFLTHYQALKTLILREPEYMI